jgi:hypothetical protein
MPYIRGMSEGISGFVVSEKIDHASGVNSFD